MENKEYIIFKSTGEFIFTSTMEPTNYMNDSEFVVVHADKLDFTYTYSYQNGEIVRGPKWEDILPPIED